MITQWFMTFLHGLASLLSSTSRSMVPSPPSFYGSMVSGFDTVYGMVPGPIKYFLPLQALISAGAALVSLLVVLGAIRMARRVLSLFTGGGGNA